LKKQHADERRTKIIDFQPPASFVPKVVVPRTPAASVADVEVVMESADPTTEGSDAAVGDPAIVTIDVDGVDSSASGHTPGSRGTEISLMVPTAQLSLMATIDDSEDPDEASPVDSVLPMATESRLPDTSEVAEPIVSSPKIQKKAVTPRVPKTGRTQQMDLLSVNPSGPLMVDLEFMSSGRVRRVDRPECAFDGDGELLLEKRSMMSDQEIMVVASNGKSYLVKVSSIPPTTNQQSLGIELQAVIPGLAETEQVIQQVDLSATAVLLVTAQGKIKRLPIEELAATTNRGLALMKIPDGDRLIGAIPLFKETELVLGTSSGRLLRLALNNHQIPLQSRAAQSQQGIRIGNKEYLAVFVPVRSNDNLLLFTSLGYGKQMAVSSLRLMSIGSMGDVGMRFSDPRDHLLQGIVARPNAEVLALSNGGSVVPLSIDQVPLMGKEGVGELWFEMEAEERLEKLSIAIS
jgi:DNA gyrase/topoisomerase IV subunit A